VILLAGSRRIIDMQVRSVGIDLGKTTFHLVALGDNGKVLLKKKFTQKQLITFTANLQTSLIGLEACSGAHFLGRALRAQGHDVKLIPSQFVKPFVKSNKNDFLDAEAIAEVVDRQNMRFVPIKTDDQLDLQAMHRVRDRLVARRTSVINQLRAFLLERGMGLCHDSVQAWYDKQLIQARLMTTRQVIQRCSEQGIWGGRVSVLEDQGIACVRRWGCRNFHFAEEGIACPLLDKQFS
jgi:transposase